MAERKRDGRLNDSATITSGEIAPMTIETNVVKCIYESMCVARTVRLVGGGLIGDWT